MIWKLKTPRIDKTILGQKKKKSWRFKLIDLKAFKNNRLHGVVLAKDRLKNQNRIESPETDTSGQLIFNKDATTMQWERMIFLTNGTYIIS